MKDRTVSFRVQGELFEKAVAVAKTRDQTLGEVVRIALESHVDSIMKTQEFVRAAEAQRDYWEELLQAEPATSRSR